MFPSVSVVGNNHSSPNGKRFVGNIYICGVFFINKSNFHSFVCANFFVSPIVTSF